METSHEADTVEHDPRTRRFLVVVDGHRATLEYRLADRQVLMLGVQVPAPIEGRGLASRLTAAAVAWAESAGLPILSQCSYVDAWLLRRRSGAGGAPR